jgi:hypothetical protein
MYTEHPEFTINKTKEMSLWRYMDFWKFLKLISTSNLFFPNIEMLGDQHEGKIPEKVYQMMVKDKRLGGEKFAKDYRGFIETNLRSKTLICSWVASEKESFAMWKMYSKEKLGLALKTNHERLKTSFKNSSENIYIGEVTYYNDEKPSYKIGNTFYTFLVKHNYYDFEYEVRCITEIGDSDKGITFKNIAVDLNTLIDEIYISPFASETGFIEIIEFLKSKYTLDFKIQISGVNDKWL